MRTLLVFGIVAGSLTLAVVSAAAAASPSVGVTAEAADTPTPTVVQRINLYDTGIRDEAAMVLVGTILIGLAGAVRRAA